MTKRFILGLFIAIVFLLALLAFQLINKEEEIIIEDLPRIIVEEKPVGFSFLFEVMLFWTRAVQKG